MKTLLLLLNSRHHTKKNLKKIYYADLKIIGKVREETSFIYQCRWNRA